MKIKSSSTMDIIQSIPEELIWCANFNSDRSIQTYQNAMDKRYHLITMPERIERRPLPTIDIVDMKGKEEGPAKDQIIHGDLIKALDQTLRNGNQAMLFLNRRGYLRISPDFHLPVRCVLFHKHRSESGSYCRSHKCQGPTDQMHQQSQVSYPFQQAVKRALLLYPG